MVGELYSGRVPCVLEPAYAGSVVERRLALSVTRLVACFGLGLIVSGCGGSAPPRPIELPYVAIELPPSARAYQSRERNARHPIVQLRFELDPDDVLLLEQRLPCRLGPVEVGPPKYALVTTNEEPWYQPETTRRHRGCDFVTGRGMEASSFLLALDDPAKVVVYGVLAYEWARNH